MIRVLLAEDQPLIRSALRALLGAESDIEVVAEAGNGDEAVALARQHRPDVALIDIVMPGLDGIEATRIISADPSLTEVHIVILTNHGLDKYVFDALRAGAAGFLVKDIEPEDLIHAVRSAARGDVLLAPSITRKLISSYISRPVIGRADGALMSLTPRERQVVVLVAQGLSDEQISEQLVISPLTARTHVNRAMTKLDARTRAQLVVLAYESGLVVPRNT